MDEEITRCLESSRETAATDLIERYRLAGQGRDHFVAALIARLCLLHTQAELHKEAR